MRPVRRRGGLVMGCGELLVSRLNLPKPRATGQPLTRPRRQGEGPSGDRR